MANIRDVHQIPSIHVLVIGGVLLLIGYLVGDQTHTDRPTVLGCKELQSDAELIVEQRLAEKKRIDDGKPVEKSWLNLPDSRRSLDIQHMRALGCANLPTDFSIQSNQSP